VKSEALFRLMQTKEEIMAIHCPACGSSQVISKNYGRKAGGFVGLIGGAAAGFVGAANGARTGAAVGMASGPIGLSVCTLGGAILGGLLGAASGGVTGAKLGEKLDKSFLENYRCQFCDHTFSKSKH
jgi:hypothetical protein